VVSRVDISSFVLKDILINRLGYVLWARSNYGGILLIYWDSKFRDTLAYPYHSHYARLDIMENKEVHEFERVMWHHADLIQSNIRMLCSISYKVAENEHLCINQ
jgi:hypothetical protein